MAVTPFISVTLRTKAGESSPCHEQLSAGRIGPQGIRRGSLALERETRLRNVFEYMSPYLGESFEKFGRRILRNEDPDPEIQFWQILLDFHQNVLEENPDATGADVFKSIWAVFSGAIRPSGVSNAIWDAVNTLLDEIDAE